MQQDKSSCKNEHLNSNLSLIKNKNKFSLKVIKHTHVDTAT